MAANFSNAQLVKQKLTPKDIKEREKPYRKDLELSKNVLGELRTKKAANAATQARAAKRREQRENEKAAKAAGTPLAKLSGYLYYNVCYKHLSYSKNSSVAKLEGDKF